MVRVRDAIGHRRRFSTENSEASGAGSPARRPFRPGGRRRGVLACMNSSAPRPDTNPDDERRTSLARPDADPGSHRLMLRSCLTLICSCDPARVWMQAKTKNTRDSAATFPHGMISTVIRRAPWGTGRKSTVPRGRGQLHDMKHRGPPSAAEPVRGCGRPPFPDRPGTGGGRP